jgi:hypothetical protein
MASDLDPPDDYIFRRGSSLSIAEPMPGTGGVTRAWLDDAEISVDDALAVLSGARSASSVMKENHDPGDEDRGER